MTFPPPDFPPPPAALSAAESPNEARSFIEAGLGRDLSLNETLRQVRAGGLSISNSFARQIAAEFYQAQGAASVLQHTNFAFRPSDAAFPVKDTLTGGQYVVYGRVQVAEDENGQPLYAGVNATFAEPLTRSQLNSRLLEILGPTITSRGLTVSTSQIEYVQSYRQGA